MRHQIPTGTPVALLVIVTRRDLYGPVQWDDPTMPKLKALVATGNDDWEAMFAEGLIQNGCDVHTSSHCLEAIDLLRKHRYDVVLVDEDLEDGNQVEFLFNLRDMVPSMPVVLASGSSAHKRQKLWRLCNVFFAGSRTRVAGKIAEAVHKARGRTAAARGSRSATGNPNV